VLYRSAATLAMDCGLIKEAFDLAQCGLQGQPPFDIAHELRQVLDACAVLDAGKVEPGAEKSATGCNGPVAAPRAQAGSSWPRWRRSPSNWQPGSRRKKMGYKLNTIVAFSGSVTDPVTSPEDLTETSALLNPLLKDIIEKINEAFGDQVPATAKKVFVDTHDGVIQRKSMIQQTHVDTLLAYLLTWLKR
jgi:hypothetical protein